MLATLAHLAVGSTAVVGCATDRPAPPRALRVEGAAGSLALLFPAAARPDPAAWLVDAAEHALARLAHHELALGTRCLVRLHPTVLAFVEATGRTEAWLRAWASWDTVDVLAPVHWQDPSQLARRQRLAHELTHCATWHAFLDEDRARAAHLPWWFEEGVASAVAEQGERRMPRDLVLARTAAAGISNPLAVGDLVARDQPLAYAAAHHAIAALLAREGRGVVRRVLDEAAAGPPGPGALERALPAVTGLDVAGLWAATAST